MFSDVQKQNVVCNKMSGVKDEEVEDIGVNVAAAVLGALVLSSNTQAEAAGWYSDYLYSDYKNPQNTYDGMIERDPSRSEDRAFTYLPGFTTEKYTPTAVTTAISEDHRDLPFARFHKITKDERTGWLEKAKALVGLEEQDYYKIGLPDAAKKKMLLNLKDTGMDAATLAQVKKVLDQSGLHFLNFFERLQSEFQYDKQYQGLELELEQQNTLFKNVGSEYAGQWYKTVRKISLQRNFEKYNAFWLEEEKQPLGYDYHTWYNASPRIRNVVNPQNFFYLTDIVMHPVSAAFIGNTAAYFIVAGRINSLLKDTVRCAKNYRKINIGDPNSTFKATLFNGKRWLTAPSPFKHSPWRTWRDMLCVISDAEFNFLKEDIQDAASSKVRVALQNGLQGEFDAVKSAQPQAEEATSVSNMVDYNIKMDARLKETLKRFQFTDFTKKLPKSLSIMRKIMAPSKKSWEDFELARDLYSMHWFTNNVDGYATKFDNEKHAAFYKNLPERYRVQKGVNMFENKDLFYHAEPDERKDTFDFNAATAEKMWEFAKTTLKHMRDYMTFHDFSAEKGFTYRESPRDWTDISAAFERWIRKYQRRGESPNTWIGYLYTKIFEFKDLDENRWFDFLVPATTDRREAGNRTFLNVADTVLHSLLKEYSDLYPWSLKNKGLPKQKLMREIVVNPPPYLGLLENFKSFIKNNGTLWSVTKEEKYWEDYDYGNNENNKNVPTDLQYTQYVDSGDISDKMLTVYTVNRDLATFFRARRLYFVIRSNFTAAKWYLAQMQGASKVATTAGAVALSVGAGYLFTGQLVFSASQYVLSTFALFNLEWGIDQLEVKTIEDADFKVDAAALSRGLERVVVVYRSLPPEEMRALSRMLIEGFMKEENWFFHSERKELLADNLVAATLISLSTVLWVLTAWPKIGKDEAFARKLIVTVIEKFWHITDYNGLIFAVVRESWTLTPGPLESARLAYVVGLSGTVNTLTGALSDILKSVGGVFINN